MRDSPCNRRHGHTAQCAGSKLLHQGADEAGTSSRSTGCVHADSRLQAASVVYSAMLAKL